MEKKDVEMYGLICKDRFDSHDKKLDTIETHLVNHIPHKIDKMFWKFLGIILVFSAIVVAVIKLTQ